METGPPEDGELDFAFAGQKRRGQTLVVLQSGKGLDATSSGESPKQLWRAAQLRPGTASPVVAAERVFTLNDGGVLTCADAADGKRLWQLRLNGAFSATPVAAGNHLYCVSEKG